MTCIATDGKTLAGDGRVTAQGLIQTEEGQKVFYAKDGSVVGCSGACTTMELARKWFEGGCPFDVLPKVEDKDFAALILRPDGRIEWMDVSFAFVPCMAPAAIGSGDEIAIGLMLAGKTPKEAVEITATRMCTVGGKIVELRPRA